MMTFSIDFNKIRNYSSIFKIVGVFDPFYRIINYWCIVNKQVFDYFFDLLPTFNHVCL